MWGEAAGRKTDQKAIAVILMGDDVARSKAGEDEVDEEGAYNKLILQTWGSRYRQRRGKGDQIKQSKPKNVVIEYVLRFVDSQRIRETVALR